MVLLNKDAGEFGVGKTREFVMEEMNTPGFARDKNCVTERAKMVSVKLAGLLRCVFERAANVPKSALKRAWIMPSSSL